MRYIKYGDKLRSTGSRRWTCFKTSSADTK